LFTHNYQLHVYTNEANILSGTHVPQRKTQKLE